MYQFCWTIATSMFNPIMSALTKSRVNLTCIDEHGKSFTDTSKLKNSKCNIGLAHKKEADKMEMAFTHTCNTVIYATHNNSQPK